MPKFDASTFSDVEYDFTGFKSAYDGTYIQDKGVVPEPSRQLVGQTMAAISKTFKEMKLDGSEELGDNPTPEQVAAAMNKLDMEDEDTFSVMAEKMLGTIAEFCQGHPSKESLDALSWPKFMAFFGYIMDNMLSPEASVPGTNATPKRLRSV